MFEEHPRIGVPCHCAGLLTDAAISLTGVSPGILSTLYGADVVLPDGRTVHVRSEEPKARTVDRAELDSLMADRALAAGAEYSLSDRVDSFSVSDNGVALRCRSSGGHRADLLVGADGNSSMVSASIPGNEAKEYLRGIQAEVSGVPLHDDVFTIRLGSRYAPGFFAWEIPCGDFTRVGLCIPESEGSPWPFLSRMLSDLNLDSRVVSRSCGRIPIGARCTMSSDRIMLIGDAASQVKPVSGGGIYPSMTAAPILADVASAALDAGDLSARRLSRYDRRFRKALGKDLERASELRRQFLRMDDGGLDLAGGYAMRPDVKPVLDTIDLDDPGAVVRRLMLNPATGIIGVLTLVRCLL